MKVVKSNTGVGTEGNLYLWRYSELTGQGPEQPNVTGPALSRGLEQMTSRGHLQLRCSVLLWFCITLTCLLS